MFCLTRRGGSQRCARGCSACAFLEVEVAVHAKQEYENPSPSLTRDNPNIVGDDLDMCAVCRDILLCEAERSQWMPEWQKLVRKSGVVAADRL